MHAHQDTDIVSNQGFISVRHSDVSDELDNILDVVRLEPLQKEQAHLGNKRGKGLKSQRVRKLQEQYNPELTPGQRCPGYQAL
jgi:hypothetical protein